MILRDSNWTIRWPAALGLAAAIVCVASGPRTAYADNPGESKKVDEQKGAKAQAAPKGEGNAAPKEAPKEAPKQEGKPAPKAAPKPAAKVKKLSGAELYSMHCNRCHPERYPTERTAAQWRTLLLHMEIRANLPSSQARTILQYLQDNSGR